MLERSRRHLAQAAQKVLAGIRQLDERDVGYESERLLDDEHERIHEEQHYTVYHEILIHAVVNGSERIVCHQLQGEIDGAARQRHEERRLEELPSLR